MKINLKTVRQILREALGFDSYVASFIKEVIGDKNHPTAGITKDGTLSYNPNFVSKFISSKQDLFSLVFHEILHPMFGHFIYGAGRLENIAADAVINAVISCIYSAESNGGALFRKTHSPRGLNGIMRPESDMNNSRYEKFYSRLYGRYQDRSKSLTTGELIQALKILTEREKLDRVLLLGSHGEREGTLGKGISELSHEEIGRIAEDIKRSAMKRQGGRNAGYSEELFTLLMKAVKSHLSIRKALLQKFTTKRKIDRFKELFRDRRISTSPIPIHPSKRDLVLLSAGIDPFYFHNHIRTQKKRNKGLAIYLDVSGSVNEYLPRILGILQNLKNEIKNVFLFSNKVLEISFETLLKGHLPTTFGTDFNCVANSILEHKFNKALIITDGYASMSDELKGDLKKDRLKTLTILFDDAQHCETFAEFGDVVPLERVTQ